MTKTEKKLSIISGVKQLIEPILLRLESLDSKIGGKIHDTDSLYYRNEDLKKKFKLSNNTIIKYRQTGILPYTRLGDIFFYDKSKIDKILQGNAS